MLLYTHLKGGTVGALLGNIVLTFKRPEHYLVTPVCGRLRPHYNYL
jgi:hypothetical protein